MMGGGGGGTGGSSAGLFLPPGQSQAAGQLGNIIQPLADLAMGGGAGTPGAWAYPQAQSLYPGAYNPAAQYLTGDFLGGAPTLYDQGAAGAYGSAVNAGNIYGGTAPGIYNQIPGLTEGAGSALSYLPQLLGNAFSPMYGQAVAQTADNPLYPQAMTGAAQGAAYGQGGAQQMYGAGNQIMQTGFDPQSALYDRTRQQLTDQSAAASAMSGLGSSPYGASSISNALGNFDINWENNRLARQESAAGAASPLFQQAPGLAASSAALPSNTYLGQIGAVLNALGAQGKAGALGASAAPSLMSSATSGLTGANNLASGIASNTASFGSLPYQTGATIGSNAMNATSGLQSQLAGATNIGNNQFLLPQQVISDFMQYMGLGQSASSIANSINQGNFNQGMQTGGGIGSLAGMGSNALFGNQGVSGALGLGGGGGLLGGGAGLAGPGMDSLALGGLGAAGGDFGGGAAALLPMAASL